MRMLSAVPLLVISMLMAMTRGSFCLSNSRRVFISQFAAAIMSAEGSGSDDAYHNNNDNINEDDEDEIVDHATAEEGSWLDGFELEGDHSCYPAAYEAEHANQINVNNNNDDQEDEDDLDDDDDGYEGLDYMQLHPLLQIPCGISLARENESSAGPSNINNNNKFNNLLPTFFSQQTSSNNNRMNHHHHHHHHTPIQTFLDTGAQRTVMSWEAAAKIGFLLPHLDRRYAGRAAGVGSCAVLGRIPAGVTTLNLGGETVVPSPSITIIESTGTKGVDFLLGLDFLREQQAVIDLRNEELQLRVNEEDFSIPFIRPRGSLSKINENNNGGGDGEVDMSGM